MNYEKIYKELCESRKHRGVDKEVGYDIHHIIPRCLGGPDDEYNLVKLTHREHYVAHLLISKIYPDIPSKGGLNLLKSRFSRDTSPCDSFLILPAELEIELSLDNILKYITYLSEQGIDKVMIPKTRRFCSSGDLTKLKVILNTLTTEGHLKLLKISPHPVYRINTHTLKSKQYDIIGYNYIGLTEYKGFRFINPITKFQYEDVISFLKTYKVDISEEQMVINKYKGICLDTRDLLSAKELTIRCNELSNLLKSSLKLWCNKNNKRFFERPFTECCNWIANCFLKAKLDKLKGIRYFRGNNMFLKNKSCMTSKTFCKIVDALVEEGVLIDYRNKRSFCPKSDLDCGNVLLLSEKAEECLHEAYIKVVGSDLNYKVKFE